MTVAYVMEQGASIRLEGERLVVEKKKNTLHTLHIYRLSQLVLYGNVSLTPPVISKLLGKGIDTVFMTRSGRYQGRLQAPLSKNISLRCEQFARLGDREFCLNIAKSIVTGKLTNMRSVLMRIKRKTDDPSLNRYIEQIKSIAEKAREADDMESLRGFEGAGSSAYFSGFSRGFMCDGICFKKRVRRPPTDPVNVLLSLGYTLLFNNVMSAVSMVGFDPYMGALHSTEYGRPSLALDLMEEWRPVIVDTVVMSVFNLKVIDVSDFEGCVVMEDDAEDLSKGKNDDHTADAEDNEGLPIRLTDNGFRKFVVQFERKMNQKVKYVPSGQQLSYRDCIREQVRHFARVIRGEDQDYRPMAVR